MLWGLECLGCLCFTGEEEVTFPPTYRFQKWTRDRYVWEKFKATGVSGQFDIL